MAKLNNHDVVDRHNRPALNSRVQLKTYFLNDGAYIDPVDISSVTIFPVDANRGNNTIIGPAAQDGIASGLSPKMVFSNSSIDTTDDAFLESNYTPGTNASGIFRLAQGKYAVVLDGQVDLSGVFQGSAIANTASATGQYIDAWQVRLKAGNSMQLLLGLFNLYNDTFMSITEPVLLHSSARLQTKKYQLGSTIQLKVPVDVTIANEGLDEAFKNTFKEGIVTSASMEIVKENHTNNLASRVTVSAFSDTSGLVDVSPEDIILHLWDTDDLLTHASALDGTLGGPSGDFYLRVKYTILNQEFISERMPLQLR